jgi:hypothetical protein
VPGPNRLRGSLDRLTVADVADLVLGAELGSDRSQAVLSPGEEDAAVAAAGQGPADGKADATRASGDYGYGFDQRFLPHTRRTRVACACLPASSTRSARSLYPPFASPPVFHVAT